MTTDYVFNTAPLDRVSSTQSSPSLKAHGRVGSNSTTASGRVARRSMRHSMLEVGQLKKQQRQSIKFQAKNFVSKFAEDLEKHYKVGALLGEGAYGNVYACTHLETGAERAVKAILKSTDDHKNDMVLREFEVLKELDHPNVLKNYALYETDTHFYIVTDWIRGGELYDLLEREFTEQEVRTLMKALLSCMNYCHQQKIVHRDMKPENILLEESHDFSQIKVIDFGLASFFNKEGKASFTESAGSSYYMSPQVIEGSYNEKCDVWSCGIIAFILAGGYAPFAGEDEMETADAILEADQVYFDDPVWDGFSDSCLDFIEYLLTFEEDQRPTAAEALQHEWLTTSTQRLSLEEQSARDDSARLSLETLRAFHVTDSKLKQCTYSLIASQIVRKEEKNQVDQLFQMLDVDCDGQISAQDLQTVYQEQFGVELSDDDVHGIMYEVNLSGGGAITYSEFTIASLQEKGLVSAKNLETAFHMMDKSQSGHLTVQDLKDILGLADDMEEYVQQRIIGPADIDGDGQISLRDFMMYFGEDSSAPETTIEEPTPVPALKRSRTRGSVSSSRRSSVSSSRRSVRKSFRASVLCRQNSNDTGDNNDSNNMYGSSWGTINSTNYNMGSSMESSGLVAEPTFKSLLDIFENQIQDNTAHGVVNTVPTMFQQVHEEEDGENDEH